MSFENGIRKTNKCLNPVAKKSLYNCIIRFKHKLNSPSISTMRLLQINLFFSLFYYFGNEIATIQIFFLSSLFLFQQWDYHNSTLFSLLSSYFGTLNATIQFFLSSLLFWQWDCHHSTFFSHSSLLIFWLVLVN